MEERKKKILQLLKRPPSIDGDDDDIECERTGDTTTTTDDSETPQKIIMMQAPTKGGENKMQFPDNNKGENNNNQYHYYGTRCMEVVGSVLDCTWACASNSMTCVLDTFSSMDNRSNKNNKSNTTTSSVQKTPKSHPKPNHPTVSQSNKNIMETASSSNKKKPAKVWSDIVKQKQGHTKNASSKTTTIPTTTGQHSLADDTATASYFSQAGATHVTIEKDFWEPLMYPCNDLEQQSYGSSDYSPLDPSSFSARNNHNTNTTVPLSNQDIKRKMRKFAKPPPNHYYQGIRERLKSNNNSSKQDDYKVPKEIPNLSEYEKFETKVKKLLMEHEVAAAGKNKEEGAGKNNEEGTEKNNNEDGTEENKEEGSESKEEGAGKNMEEEKSIKGESTEIKENEEKNAVEEEEEARSIIVHDDEQQSRLSDITMHQDDSRNPAEAQPPLNSEEPKEKDVLEGNSIAKGENVELQSVGSRRSSNENNATKNLTEWVVLESKLSRILSDDDRLDVEDEEHITLHSM